MLLTIYDFLSVTCYLYFFITCKNLFLSLVVVRLVIFIIFTHFDGSQLPIARKINYSKTLKLNFLPRSFPSKRDVPSILDSKQTSLKLPTAPNTTTNQITWDVADLLRRDKTEKIGRKSLSVNWKKKLTLDLAPISAIRFQANLSKNKRKIASFITFNVSCLNTFQNKK